MDYFTWGLITTIALMVFHWLWKEGHKNFDVFEKQGIPFVKPTFFFGNAWPYLGAKVSMQEYIIDMYKKFPDAKIMGVFERQQPIYMIKDPELIKQMGVKDFEYFIGE